MAAHKLTSVSPAARPADRRLLQRRSEPQRRPQAAVAAAQPGGTGDQQQAASSSSQQQQAAKDKYDIVSGSRLQEQGPSCDWPRKEDQRRWQEAALVTTGFPVPAGYGTANLPPPPGSGMLWRLRNPPRDVAAAGARRAPARGQPAGAGCSGGGGSGSMGDQIVPVFRAAPYSAEAARQRRPSRTARILFLDDGCTCRAVLAQALMQAMLRKLPAPGLDAEAHAASIGPPVAGGHDERVVLVAREMDITLQPRRAWEFDEMRDTVDYDLIVVMDRYDRQEVVREVSVLERLNPGGAYLTRVHRLKSFARAGRLVLKDRCLLVPDDVPDPLYGLVSPAAEHAALRRAAHAIALGCRGLLSYLLKLRARCGSGPAVVPLSVALAQSLQCPLMDPTSHHALSALIHCQLAPAQLALWQQGQQQLQQTAAAATAAIPQQQQVGDPAADGSSGSSKAAAEATSVDSPQTGDWAAHVRGWPRPIWVESGSFDEDGEEVVGSSAEGAPRPLWTVREIGGQMVVVRRPRPDDPSSRRGYWSNIQNVQRELSKWMERQGMRDRLPTQQELRRSGANTLSARVDSHGGLAVFAESMGLPLASGRMPNGHWADFDTLARELRQFVARQQQFMQEQEVAQQQAAAAVAAVATSTLAAGQPQPTARLRRGRPIVAGPSSSLAEAGGASTSGRRAQQFASGSWSASASVPLQQPAPSSTAVTLLAEDGSPVRASGSSGGGELGSSAAREQQQLVFLPTQQELRAGGRTDLIGGIRQHGGSLAVARRLGWAVRHGRLPSEAAVVQQLLAFAEAARRASGGPVGPRPALLPMPTLRQLEEGGRADLAGAVMRLGGVQAFAALLEAEPLRGGLQARAAPAPQLGSRGQQEATRLHLRLQLQEPGRPPAGAGSHILTYPAPASSGRFSSAPRRAAVPEPPQPAVVQAGRALMQLIEARGWERRVPTKQELLAAGRRDLHAAITRCGGAQKLAEHLQLPYTETRGRRRRGQQAAPAAAVNGGEVAAAALQPSFLAARLRQPLGSLAPTAAVTAAAAASAQLPVTQRPKDPASRLLERELVEDAYSDTTFV